MKKNIYTYSAPVDKREKQLIEFIDFKDQKLEKYWDYVLKIFWA